MVIKNTFFVILSLLSLAVCLLLAGLIMGAFAYVYFTLALLTGSPWLAFVYALGLDLVYYGTIVVFTVCFDGQFARLLTPAKGWERVCTSIVHLLGLLIAQGLFLERFFPSVESQTMYTILLSIWLGKTLLGIFFRPRVQHSLRRYLR